jgi:hypothetical protein
LAKNEKLLIHKVDRASLKGQNDVFLGDEYEKLKKKESKIVKKKLKSSCFISRLCWLGW